MTSHYPPHPFGTVINCQNVIDIFEQCQNWEDKYRQIILLGKKIPTMDDDLRSKTPEISGCESEIWLISVKNDGKLHFFADSNARIIKGVVAILLTAIEGKTAEEIQKFDFNSYFGKLNINQYLSPSRQNGILNLINEIKIIK